MKRPLQSAIVLLSAVLLTACALSPAAAIRRDMPHSHRPGKMTNLQIRQSVPWRDGAVVYYTFDQLDPSGTTSECGVVVQVLRNGLAWNATGSMSVGCETHGATPGMFELTGSGSSWGPGKVAWSKVYTLVTDPAVVEMRVTWSDGATETVSVVNESFLIVRAGRVSVERIEALDAAGTVVAADPP